ncbi:MAG: hypothetical protein ACREJY_14675, partial [Candidatus Rokuibacteriota bacterium]
MSEPPQAAGAHAFRDVELRAGVAVQSGDEEAFYLLSALVATGVSALVGALLDLAAPPMRAVPFAALAAVGT